MKTPDLDSIAPQPPDSSTPENDETEGGYDIYTRIEKYLNRRYDIRYNEVKNIIEITPVGSREFVELNEADLVIEMAKCGLRASDSHIKNMLKSSWVKVYNPLRNYFEDAEKKLGEDKTDWIDKLASYAKVSEPEEFKTHFKKHLVRQVKCALENEFYNKHCLVLVGNKQSTGKSGFLQNLIPKQLIKYYTEEFSADKDGLAALSENFMINMDELGILTKTDINVLKAYISKLWIRARLPYDSRPKTMPRRATFWAATNQTEFLSDETGSVRWICFRINGMFDWKGYTKEIDIDKVWGQAFRLYKEGFKCEITPEELQKSEERNQEFTAVSVESELIAKHFRPSRPGERKYLQPSDILMRLQQLYPAFKFSPHSISRGMKVNGYELKGVKFAGKGTRRVYRIVEISNYDMNATTNDDLVPEGEEEDDAKDSNDT